jgi:hypothetical protein
MPRRLAALLALSLLAAAPARGQDGKPRSLKEVVAAARAGDAPTGEQRIAVRPRIAYDPARQVLLARAPDDLETETRVEGTGQATAPGGLTYAIERRSVTSYRLAPVRRDSLAVVETSVPYVESQKLADDLELVVTFTLAREGAAAVTRTVKRKVATPGAPWEGTLEALELAVNVTGVSLVRRSTGAVLPPAAAPGPPAKGKAPSSRAFLDNQGRPGFRWTMRAQDEYLEVCRASLKGQDNDLSIERRCKCMLMQMQVAYPRRPPPGGIDPARDRDMRRTCSPE